MLTEPGSAATQSGKPDPIQVVIESALIPWVAAHDGECLPPPLPVELRDAALWWARSMQEPEEPGETRMIGGEEGRWHCGYGLRLAFSLLGFLRLSPTERDAVVAGVSEDRIPYRGDRFAEYLAICDETHLMRKIGRVAYRKRMLERSSAVDMSLQKSSGRIDERAKRRALRELDAMVAQ